MVAISMPMFFVCFVERHQVNEYIGCLLASTAVEGSTKSWFAVVTLTQDPVSADHDSVFDGSCISGATQGEFILRNRAVEK